MSATSQTIKLSWPCSISMRSEITLCYYLSIIFTWGHHQLLATVLLWHQSSWDYYHIVRAEINKASCLKSSVSSQFIPCYKPQMCQYCSDIMYLSRYSFPDILLLETRDVMGTGPESRTVSSFPLDCSDFDRGRAAGGRIEAEQKWIRGRQILDFRQTTCHTARVTERGGRERLRLGEKIWIEKKYLEISDEQHNMPFQM